MMSLKFFWASVLEECGSARGGWTHMPRLGTCLSCSCNPIVSRRKAACALPLTVWPGVEWLCLKHHQCPLGNLICEVPLPSLCIYSMSGPLESPVHWLFVLCFPASTPSARSRARARTHTHSPQRTLLSLSISPPSLSFCVCVSLALSLSPLVRPPDLSVHWLLRVYFSCPAPNECPLVLLFPLPPPTPRLCPAHVLYVYVHPSPDVQVRRDVTSALELAAQGGFCHFFISLSLFSKKPWRLSHNPSSLRHLCIISNLFWMSKALMKIFSLESPF